MLNNIHIQNFRCFEEIKIEGFERINLIGGLNNSGKTCLLEAIGALAYNYKLEDLLLLRGEISNNFKNMNNENGETKITPDFYISDSNNVEDSTNLENFENIFNARKVEFLHNDGSVTGLNVINVNFISSNNEVPKLDVIKSFDTFDTELIKYKLIQILQTVDERIEDIRTFKTREGLLIKKQGEKYQPISFYGDAINKILKYFTPIFEKSLVVENNKRTTYLLLDEVENGLHYTAQKEIWTHIFKLSKELNVQVFATSHSLEMIKAFNEVAKKEGDAAYFEMSREYESGKIFAFKHDMELLEYALTKETSTIRG